jgi:hypothetical protein
LKDRYFELKNLVGAILLFSVVLWGCQKGDQSLGINLLPGVKTLQTRFHQEKTSIATSIFTDTKIRVDRPSYNLLGSFNDPVFGRTDAGFAAQFRLPYHPSFQPGAVIDSVVLHMSYKKIYGDTVSRQTVKVYELNSALSYDAKYLSSFDVKTIASTELLGAGSFIPKFRTDTLTPQDTTLQNIRIRLNNNFGTKLLAVDSLNMLSNDIFVNIFKGLYIEPTPISRKGTVVSIEKASSMLVLYFHDEKSDTLGFAYRVSANSANLERYNHDYTASKFYPNLNKEKNLDSLIFVQPTGGIKSKIDLPSLSTWKDSSNYIINKATLTFHADTILSDSRRYEMPYRLFIMVHDSTGVEAYPADSQLSSEYYGGFYDALTATYSFNVTQHLQQLIKGTIKNTGFYLVHSDRNGTLQRVGLKGQGSTLPPELNVTYTRYK